MFLRQKIAELKFPNRTPEFSRIAELKNANEQIIKKACKIEEFEKINLAHFPLILINCKSLFL